MSASKIIDELVKRPREDVEADLHRVLVHMKQLEEEEQFLRAILRLQGSDGALSNGQEVRPKVSAAAGGDSTSATRKAKRAKRPTTREHILGVISPTGFEPWPIPRVIEAVQKRDPEINDAAIRVALRRMLSGGLLMRDSNGNYRLEPTKQGAQGRFSIEAPG